MNSQPLPRDPAPTGGTPPSTPPPVKAAPLPNKPGNVKVLGKKPNAPRARKRTIDIIKKKVGGFLFQLITFSLFMTALGIWGYSRVIELVRGRFELFDWQSSAATLYGTPKILIIEPLRTEDFLRPDTANHDTLWPYEHRMDDWPLRDTMWYAPEMKRPKAAAFEAWKLLGTPDTKNVGLADFWKELFLLNKIAFKAAEEPALAALPDDINMLILPGCLLLSKEEKIGLKNFVARGGKLLMCWSTGCRDENGDWAGYTFLEQMIGGKLSDPASEPCGGTAYVLRNEGPLTAMMPPGQHLEFFTYNGFVSMNIVEPRTTVDAWQFKPYWKDGGTEAISKPAVIAHSNYIAGRVVWFAFTAESIEPHKDNAPVMEKLALNSVNWLIGKPVVDIHLWPSGYNAGGSIVLDGKGTGAGITNALRNASSAGREMDVIVYPESYPDGLDLGGVNYGDLIIGAPDTSVIQNQNMDYLDWVLAKREWLEKLTGRKPAGLLMPDWWYDPGYAIGTLRGDMRYMLANPDPRYYGPRDEVIHVSGWWIFSKFKPLALLPKCQVSAEEWVTYGKLPGGSVMGSMATDMRRIQRYGGIYIGIVPPEGNDGANAATLEPRMAAMMDSLNIWRATTHEVINRIAGWQGLRIAMNEVTATRLRMDISNESDVVMQNVVVEVYFAPQVISNVAISAQSSRFKPGGVLWSRKSGLCSFTLPEMPPGVNGTLFIDAAPATDKSEAN